MAPKNDKARPWRGKKEELLLVNSAADRELDDASSRDSSLRSRATILIGAASVIGAIQLGDGFNLFLVLSLIASLVAAVFGVAVVYPRGSGAFNPRTMWDEFYDGTSIEEALHHSARIKVKWLDREDKSIKRRSNYLRIGLIVLVVASMLAVLAAVFPHGVSGIISNFTPTPTPRALS